MSEDATGGGPADESATDGDAPLADDLNARRKLVRERYADVATDDGDCCGGGETPTENKCCGPAASGEQSDGTGSQRLGYDADEVESVADGADLGLGCGNPKALADLDPGETVLDLGSGAGFDCFLAAREVGESGQVIGVDMTPEMVTKARENVGRNDSDNVEFRLGEIEHLPVADGVADVVISNCVINLSPEKQQVFDEAFRALRPTGRLAVTDVVRTAPFPQDVRLDLDSVSSCVAGAATVGALEAMLNAAGFNTVSITPKEDSAEFISEWDDERDLSEYLVSALIQAVKPDRPE